MKTALICGVSGQDGSLLADLLLREGYRVVGTSRDPSEERLRNLEALGVREQVEVQRADLGTLDGATRAIGDAEPDEVYALAGQSSVGLSFEQPLEAFESLARATTHLLEAIRRRGRPIRFFYAASGDCFGETAKEGANESTPLRPRSPYAAAKASGFFATKVYREAYGLHACSAFLFNHESPLRPERFVTRKIIAAACRIAAGHDERLTLGDLRVRRDWGWATEYVEAMWRMLQAREADDFVIATGESHSLQELVEAAFEAVGLEASRYVDFDPALVRAAEIMVASGDPSRAREKLGWSATTRMKDVVRKMIAEERARIPRSGR